MRGQDPCDRTLQAWQNIRSYRCTYRAVTSHEGKKSETLMTYTYEKPGKIRMDIEKPRRGAVLIYNPEISPKVKVRPFPKLSGFALSYNLTDKRVTSDGGGTLDRSDLGHRMEAFCADWTAAKPKPEPSSQDGMDVIELAGTHGLRKWFFSTEDGLLRKVETYEHGNLSETFEWTHLIVNPALDPGLFQKF